MDDSVCTVLGIIVERLRRCCKKIAKQAVSLMTIELEPFIRSRDLDQVIKNTFNQRHVLTSDLCMFMTSSYPGRQGPEYSNKVKRRVVVDQQDLLQSTLFDKFLFRWVLINDPTPPLNSSSPIRREIDASAPRRSRTLFIDNGGGNVELITRGIV